MHKLDWLKCSYRVHYRFLSLKFRPWRYINLFTYLLINSQQGSFWETKTLRSGKWELLPSDPHPRCANPKYATVVMLRFGGTINLYTSTKYNDWKCRTGKCGYDSWSKSWPLRPWPCLLLTLTLTLTLFSIADWLIDDIYVEITPFYARYSASDRAIWFGRVVLTAVPQDNLVQLLLMCPAH